MNVFSRDYIDSLYDDYQQDPSSLPVEWQTFFETFDPSSQGVDFNRLPSVSGSATAATASPGEVGKAPGGHHPSNGVAHGGGVQVNGSALAGTDQADTSPWPSCRTVLTS